MKLSILIITIPERADKLQRLMDVLRPQIPGDNSVEVLVKEELPSGDGGPTIGANRNAAVADAIGDYVCFVDDDDMVAKDYIERIFKALDQHLIGTAINVVEIGPVSLVDAIKQGSPDVVGINGHYIVGDKKPELFIHSIKYKQWRTEDGVHYRCPNHLNPVKRELSLQVKFPEKDHGEDTDYSMRLRPLLKTEVMVDGILYFYLKD